MLRVTPLDENICSSHLASHGLCPTGLLSFWFNTNAVLAINDSSEDNNFSECGLEQSVCRLHGSHLSSGTVFTMVIDSTVRASFPSLLPLQIQLLSRCFFLLWNVWSGSLSSRVRESILCLFDFIGLQPENEFLKFFSLLKMCWFSLSVDEYFHNLVLHPFTIIWNHDSNVYIPQTQILCCFPQDSRNEINSELFYFFFDFLSSPPVCPRFDLVSFYNYSFHGCVCVCVCAVPMEARGGVRSPGTRAVIHNVGEINPGPQQEQQLPLATVHFFGLRTVHCHNTLWSRKEGVISRGSLTGSEQLRVTPWGK